MFALLLNAFPCLFFTLVSTLSISPSISLQSSNTTGNLRLPKPICSTRYGHNLQIDSCRLALSEMDLSTDLKRYISRHGSPQPLPPNLVLTPIRYLSDDGLCAIDVLLQPASDGDEASAHMLYHSAKSIIDDCVVGLGRSGIFQVVSRHHELKVIVRSYEPSVECEPGVQQPPNYNSCQELLQRVPSNPKSYLFARSGQRYPPGLM